MEVELILVPGFTPTKIKTRKEERREKGTKMSYIIRPKHGDIDKAKIKMFYGGETRTPGYMFLRAFFGKRGTKANANEI